MQTEYDFSSARENPYAAEIPNTETRKAIEDAETGIGMSGPFLSIEELMAALNDDD